MYAGVLLGKDRQPLRRYPFQGPAPPDRVAPAAPRRTSEYGPAWLLLQPARAFRASLPFRSFCLEKSALRTLYAAALGGPAISCAAPAIDNRQFLTQLLHVIGFRNPHPARILPAGFSAVPPPVQGAGIAPDPSGGRTLTRERAAALLSSPPAVADPPNGTP